MRHQKRRGKLGRNASHRRAMMRNQVTSFFKHERIETTLSKAKELARMAEKIITLGKRGNLHARRMALKDIDKAIVKKVFDEIAPRFQSRNGGYTRVIKLGKRQGDGAQMALIEMAEGLVEVTKGSDKKGS